MIRDQRRGGVAVGVVSVGGKAVVDGEGLGLRRDDLANCSAGGSRRSVSYEVIRIR